MGWRVALTAEADTDLGNVVSFLAQKSPEAAERLGLELVALIFSLDQMPSRGAPVKSRPWLRKVAYRHYVVIYHINETQRLVEVIRVWDGRRDPRSLALR